MLTVFTRFVVVGLFNTGLGYFLYVSLLWLGLHYSAANLGSIMMGVPIGFMLHKHFVFEPSSSRPRVQRPSTGPQLLRFVSAWAVIYGLSTVLIALVMRLGVSDYLAGLAVLPMNVVLSFLANRYIVFR